MAIEKTDFSEELLRELTNAEGVSGYEDGARSVMNRYIKPLADKVEFDRLGSLIATHGSDSKGPKVLVAGHLDEIGFMVKEITPEGFIKFLPLGGWWGHVTLGQRLRIVTSKGPVLGVVGSRPPHLLEAKEREKVLELKDMFIDIGSTEKFNAAKKLGVRIGDPIVPESEFTVMGNKKLYLAKAFDNRASCAMVVDLFRKFQRSKRPNQLFGAGCVQEEVGLRGANTVANSVNPDVAIICDIGIAQDTPPTGFSREEKLGAGPLLLAYDATMIPNIRLRDLVIDTAKKKKIPYSMTTMERGGTDGGRVHVSGVGVPSVVIGAPIRYIHSHNGIMSRSDYDNAVRLVYEVVKRLDRKTVEGLYPKA